MNVENVVYAPTNPTATVNRSVAVLMRSEIVQPGATAVRNQPRMKLPVTLMTSVPTGNDVSNNLPQTRLTKSRLVAPRNPAAPTARYWISIFIRAALLRPVAPGYSAGSGGCTSAGYLVHRQIMLALGSGHIGRISA